MTIQVINTGTGPNSGNGDSIRTAFSKVNANFAELATIATGTNFDLLAISSSIIPATDQNYSLGSASDQWENLYLGPNGVTIDGNELTIDGSGNITVNGTPFQSGFASTSSLINGPVQVQLDNEGSLNFPPNGVLQSYISSSTTATIFLIDDIMLDSPVMIHTVGPHTLSNSDLVKLTGIGTTVELNNKYHYVSVVNTTTVDLYEDAALSIPVDGTNYTPFLGLSNSETFTNTGTTGRSNVISQFLDVYPDIVNVRVNWYASGSGIDQPDPDNTTYTVIKQPGFLAYLVDGVVNKPLYLQRGNTYYLDVYSPPHPVYIQTTGAGYNPADVYSLGVTNQGTGEGIITFTVPLNAPDTLYYQCQHHAAMVGPIYISDGVGKSKVLAVNTQTTSSRVLYQFILENTWPLVNQASYAFTGTFEGGGQLEFQDVEARLTVKSNEQTWIFNPTGVLTLPPEGDIQRNGLSVLNSLKGRTFVVTETDDGEKYVFNGQPDSPDIVLIRGLTYYFEANLPGHPFWIQSTPGAFDINSVYTDGIINNGVEVGTLTFTVPENTADILYYACEYHAGMTGQFLVKNLGDELDLTQVHTDVTPDEQYTHDLGSTSTHWRNLYARTGFFGNLPSWTVVNPLSVFTSDVNGYSQIQAQNQSTGTSASTDFVATADSGDDETDYIDLGINGSNYVNEDWTISGGRDGYLYVSGNNLTVGTDSSGTTVKIHIGGTLEENIVATFDAAGTESTSTTTGALTIVGGVGIAGDIVSHNLVPAADLTYDLGSTSSQWRSLYVGTSTIYLGGTALSVSGGNLTIDGSPVQGGGGAASLGDRLTSSTYEVILEGTTGTVSVPHTIISQGYELVLAGSQGSYEINRYLRVRDGDVFSHLHLDTADNSTYDIFLGDDSKFVKVDHTGTVVIGTWNGTQNTWTFGTNGNLIFPDGTTQTTAYTGAGGTGTSSSLVNGTWTVSLSTSGELTLLTDTLLVMPDLLGSSALKVAPEKLFAITGEGTTGGVALNWASDFNDYGNSSNAAVIINSPFAGSSGTVQVVVNTSSTTRSWVYDAEGKFVLPGGGNIVGNNYNVNIVGGNDGSSTYGDVNIVTNNPFSTSTWSFGTAGELTLPSGGEITSSQITNEVFGTTTTSLTLVPGGATELGQRLEIYSTIGGEGNHLHLTSGSTSTDLFLGNDSQYVRLGGNGNIEISSQNGLTLWGEGVMSNAYLILPNNIDSSSTNVTLGNVNGDVLIQASEPGNPVPQNWFFGRDGSLTFPDGTTQTTAFNFIDTIPASSTSTGIKGQIAVTTSSMYVCIGTDSWLRFDGVTF